MRLLLFNPNTSHSLTDRMAATARAALPEGVTLSIATAPRGFPYISNRSEAQIAGAVTLEVLATEAAGTDAAIIAAFGDPGVPAARDLFPFPVIGPAEASMLTAAMLGDRFSIVAFTPRMQSWYRDAVHEVGLDRRFAGFRAPRIAPRSPETAQEDLRDDLLDCIRACCEEDGADVVITAGAPLAGFAALVRADAAAPLVDPIAAAVQQALTLARMAVHDPGAPRIYGDPKPSMGLDPALAARFQAREPAPSPIRITNGPLLGRVKP